MKLASLDDIVHLKPDHGRGCLVDTSTGKKVALTDFRIVYARYGKRSFDKDSDDKWFLSCSSGDAVTGTTKKGESLACGSALICSSCKPVLMLGLRTEKGRLAVLDASATVARSMGEAVETMSRRPVPIFDALWRLRVMLVEKGMGITFMQAQLGEVESTKVPVRECMEARVTLMRVIDQKMDRSAQAPSRPALGGATLKM